MQNEHNISTLVIILLAGVSLIATLFFETRLTSWAYLEMVLLLFAMMVATALFFGLWLDEPWTQPLAIIFFSGLIANLLWMFSITPAKLTFLFGVLVNVAGIAIAVSLIEKPASYDIQTYEVEEAKRDIAQQTQAKKKRK